MSSSPSAQALVNTRVNSLLRFLPNETLTIEGETIQYGDAEYTNPMFDMLGCLLWRNRYFILEHAHLLSKEGTVFIGCFQGESHFNYGICQGITVTSDEDSRRNALVEFFKNLLRREQNATEESQ